MKYLKYIITMSIFLYPYNVFSQSISTFKAAVEINDQIITNYEIAQRIKMLQTFGANSIINIDVINSLIDESLYSIAAIELEVIASEAEIDEALENFAKRGDLTKKDLLAYLESRNIAQETLLAYISSGLTKRKVIQKKFINNMIISQNDLASEIDTERLLSRNNSNIFEYIELSFVENTNSKKSLKVLSSIDKMVDNCLDLQSAVKKYEKINLIIKKMKKKDLERNISIKLNNLDIYETNIFKKSNNKIYLLMLCSRNSDIDDISLETIRNEIFDTRIKKLGNAYIQELRGEAFINIK
tara:strand:- start:1068 stop:1964 length:897 start_codon:yes stop_codon:yes gene_type:complete